MNFEFRLPEYLRSTDFKTFEALYRIMFGAIKKDINGITNLKDVDKCSEHMLPILAASIGCDYFTETTPGVNRLIIKNWWWLMKNKGTIAAIQVASSLALIAYDNSKINSSDNIMYGRTVDVIVDQVTGEIYIRVAYQSEEDEDQEEQMQWIKKFVEYVRPAGYKISLIPSKFTKAFLDMIMRHDVRIMRINYKVRKQSALTDNLFYSYTIDDSQIPQDCKNGFTWIYDNDMNPIEKIRVGFGQWNEKADICQPGTCPYVQECQNYTTLGVGFQELSSIDTIERYDPNNPDN